MMEDAENSTNSVMRPSFFWLATEGQRALLELSTLLPYQLLKKNRKSGDGHPVLVLPGFMASDLSTTLLRNFLNQIGYHSYPWGIGRNYGAEVYLELMIQRVEDLYLTHHSSVSLVGWSLGGVFAREIAKKRPEIIRQVVTLGSPFGGITQPNNASWLHRILTGGRGTDEVDRELLENLIHPAPVPTTAIYSKEDGVVSWKVCMEQRQTNIHQNIQVRGSHFGLGVNPRVFQIIKDRLQYDRHNWQHYSRS